MGKWYGLIILPLYSFVEIASIRVNVYVKAITIIIKIVYLLCIQYIYNYLYDYHVTHICIIMHTFIAYLRVSF